ncbi:hypothetical protein BOTBODRAFT_34843 [Botryobasidium botryosum FD-172 SS1]|uniref:Uncharacterized protein n=1 Tax=Botryobasidium botryosum (strain FD-172 SS1) TaxID=930990 RepID=A0A067M884_BOTB1|nr:hypothetical protein BOTBODRAFT_34843 [Botryobasidium botryosum FD-172 SS1]
MHTPHSGSSTPVHWPMISNPYTFPPTLPPRHLHASHNHQSLHAHTSQAAHSEQASHPHPPSHVHDPGVGHDLDEWFAFSQ